MIPQKEYDRITFSLPRSMNLALDNLKKEIKSSKSEIIKLALKAYLTQQKAKKIQEAVNMMAQEYENDTGLTEMTIIDAEDFVWNKELSGVLIDLFQVRSVSQKRLVKKLGIINNNIMDACKEALNIVFD